MSMKRKRSPELEERISKTKAAAHERVVKDGTVQFRLDAKNMERLLHVADDRRTGVGVLARMWVLERLQQESGSCDGAIRTEKTELARYGGDLPFKQTVAEPLERFVYRLEQLSEGMHKTEAALDWSQRMMDMQMQLDELRAQVTKLKTESTTSASGKNRKDRRQ